MTTEPTEEDLQQFCIMVRAHRGDTPLDADRLLREALAIVARRRADRHWRALRVQVYERDKGICQVCGVDLTDDGFFDCGHIVDRACGGEDTLVDDPDDA